MMHVDWIAILQSNKLMRSHEEVEAFEYALAEIAREPKVADLVDLHLVFDDNCHHEEVMFGLIHFLESFETEMILSAFIQAMPKMLTQAREWVLILHYRILNDDFTLRVYKSLLASAEVHYRDVAFEVLKEISLKESEPLALSARKVLEN